MNIEDFKERKRKFNPHICFIAYDKKSKKYIEYISWINLWGEGDSNINLVKRNKATKFSSKYNYWCIICNTIYALDTAKECLTDYEEYDIKYIPKLCLFR